MIGRASAKTMVGPAETGYYVRCRLTKAILFGPYAQYHCAFGRYEGQKHEVVHRNRAGEVNLVCGSTG